MKASFWHEKWEKNEIGFHASEYNPWLLAYWEHLKLKPEARVWVPLCGKTLDIHWLLSQGYHVVGCELSPLAVNALFQELKQEPQITETGSHKCYQSAQLEILVGDFFELSAECLGPIDAIYDRAALVALPPEMRRQYAARQIALTGGAPQLLIVLDYDPSLKAGPPFAISRSELETLYGSKYQVEILQENPMPAGLHDGTPAWDRVCLLRPRACR